MNSLSATEKLDTFLKNLLDEHKSLPQMEYILNLSSLGVQEIAGRLIKDGYITVVPGVSSQPWPTYLITFDGRIFCEQDGYKNQHMLESLRLNLISQNEDRRTKMERRLLWATWFAGIAGILVFLWSVFIYLYPVHKDYPYFLWETIP